MLNTLDTHLLKNLLKIRIVVFGSFYRGFFVLSELLEGIAAENITVVGVATDDPSQSFVSPQKRVWQYPHTVAERTMVEKLAQQSNIPIYSGRVKSNDFYDIFENHWKPDLCIMATFGQKINARLFETPALGFYNLHPCLDDGWPSRYVGGNPFQALMDDKKKYTQIAMHRVNEEFDTGELIAYSEKIYIPENATVVDLHKLTSPTAGKLAVSQIAQLIEQLRRSSHVA